MTEAYNQMYLDGTIEVTRLAFSLFNDTEHDIYQQIDRYMRESPVRAGMDAGLWKELMKGSKQLIHSISVDDIPDGEHTDGIMLHFLADVYVYWQWQYMHTSKEISLKCDAKTLSELYYPIHEMSLQGACRRLESRFFGAELMR